MHYIPKELRPEVLYVSEEFSIAVHLCACGCGSKVKTPLGPTEWSVTETAQGPSVWPSIGNWQQPCQSHYVIAQGKVRWAPRWTPEEIASGRRREEERRLAYYEAMYRKRRTGFLQRAWQAVKAFFERLSRRK